MCQAAVFMVQDGQQREIMRDVTHLSVVEGGVQLETFFEEPRFVPGRIVSIDLLKHIVKLVPLKNEGE